MLRQRRNSLHISDNFTNVTLLACLRHADLNTTAMYTHNDDGYYKKSKNYTDDEIYRRIHFAVMAIESGARKLGISGKEMHDRLQKQGLIHSRLIGKYETLHTQSLEWVADDISETLLNWEAEV